MPAASMEGMSISLHTLETTWFEVETFVECIAMHRGVESITEISWVQYNDMSSTVQHLKAAKLL